MRLHPTRHEEAPTLRPETHARRRLPANFRPDDLPIFGHDLERLIPRTRLVEYRDVRLSSDGIIFKRGRMMPESFAYPSNAMGWRRRSLLKFYLSNYLLKRRRRFEPSALWVTDDWSAGYFHWLADALPRLLAVRHLLAEHTLLLPGRYERLEFVRSSLEPFGALKVEFIGPDEVLTCRRLVVPTQTAPSGHYNEELLRGVRGLLVEHFAAGAWDEAGRRVYISRGRAPKRRVGNEEEVFGVLREFGFTVMYAEDHPFAEQVRAAASARVLVSNHGAGLTNMLFMRPGARVLELRHRDDCVQNCYFTMASALGLEYFYQTCPPEKPGEAAHTSNLLVEADALRENLRLLVGR